MSPLARITPGVEHVPEAGPPVTKHVLASMTIRSGLKYDARSAILY